MISTLYWVLLHMSGYIIVMIVDHIRGWVSAPVFPSHSYLHSPKGGSSLGPDHGMNFTTNLGSLPSNGAGISLAVIETLSCTTRAWPHISPTPCCNGLHNQFSSYFLLSNISIFHQQQNSTLNHSLFGWDPYTLAITCYWELDNLKDSLPGNLPETQ